MSRAYLNCFDFFLHHQGNLLVDVLEERFAILSDDGVVFVALRWEEIWVGEEV